MIEKIKKFIKDRNDLLAVGEQMGIIGERITSDCFMMETQFMELVRKHKLDVEFYEHSSRPNRKEDWYRVFVDGIEIRTILDKKKVEELKGEGLICEK